MVGMELDTNWTLAQHLLAVAGAVVDGVQNGLATREFADLRPAHGFAFVRLSGTGATVTQLAEHLGVTKQAAGQLVDELVAKGYVVRQPHPTDARARLVVLTERGQRCTVAATEAAAETVARWRAVLGEERFSALCEDLARIAPPGPLRPTW